METTGVMDLEKSVMYNDSNHSTENDTLGDSDSNEVNDTLVTTYIIIGKTLDYSVA